MAAGVEQGRKKRRREIDYVSEIPFEKLAPSGFYDTSSDDTLMQRNRKDPGFLGKNLQQMEGMRRTEEERRARQRDKKRVKKLQQHNLPEAIMKQNALNDPGSFRKRSRLSMPAPQVSEEELEDIVKYGAAGAGGEGTSALLSQYGATPGATPMRTPRTPAGRNVIMEEARNHLALQKEQTPLKAGGERVDLVGGTGFGGVTPQHGVQTTPNVLAAAATPGRAGASATPMTARGGETPLRDELSINQDAESWAGGASQASVRAPFRGGGGGVAASGVRVIAADVTGVWLHRPVLSVPGKRPCKQSSLPALPASPPPSLSWTSSCRTWIWRMTRATRRWLPTHPSSTHAPKPSARPPWRPSCDAGLRRCSESRRCHGRWR